jgi:hypothetical protein
MWSSCGFIPFLFICWLSSSSWKSLPVFSLRVSSTLLVCRWCSSSCSAQKWHWVFSIIPEVTTIFLSCLIALKFNGVNAALTIYDWQVCCRMEDYLLICYIYISSCLLGTLFLLSLVRTQCCNSPTRVNNLQILPQFFCVLNEFPHYGSYIINFPILELFWQLGYMSPIRCVKLLECPCSVVITRHHWDGCSSSRSIVHSLLWKATWTIDIADWIIMNLWSYIPM